MNCDSTINVLTDYILGKSVGRKVNRPAEELLYHCASCPDCKEKIDILLRVVTGKDFHLSRPLICDDVLERISEMAELDENDMMIKYPAEWLHMRVCEHCREIFEMTVSCMTPEFEDEFERVHKAVEFDPDFSQLIWKKEQSYIQTLAQPLNILLSRGKNALAKIPEWLASARLVSVPATAFRSEESQESICCELKISCHQPERELIFQVYAISQNSMHLKAKLMDIHNSRAVDGVKVALLDGEGHFLAQVFTSKNVNTDGEPWAEFKNISYGQYTLRITEEKENWKIPLNLE